MPRCAPGDPRRPRRHGGTDVREVDDHDVLTPADAQSWRRSPIPQEPARSRPGHQEPRHGSQGLEATASHLVITRDPTTRSKGTSSPRAGREPVGPRELHPQSLGNHHEADRHRHLTLSGSRRVNGPCEVNPRGWRANGMSPCRAGRPQGYRRRASGDRVRSCVGVSVANWRNRYGRGSSSPDTARAAAAHGLPLEPRFPRRRAPSRATGAPEATESAPFDASWPATMRS